MILKGYDLFIKSVENIAKFLSIISTALLVIVMVLNVLFRYFLKIPLIWADEVSLFLFAWCTFLGASLTVRNGSMAAITILIDKFPTKVFKVVQVFVQFMIIIFSAIVVVYAIQWVTSPSTINTVSISSQVPMWVPYLVLPLGLLFINIFAIDNIVKVFRDKGVKEVPIEEAS
ncbi:TRAP transporter small permease [Bacillus sp. B15-48]|uniref:TRAP transporter small permease n=1 Tax=Bacillus sp. B15-48 TaxID=1548601 RepID=UPI00193F6477|nr:TRAP transporter small permease [Bacillus sp. B15-48]MBM4763652.1 TRAP transporter small permease subunit [Bacillus sp. B15-48]